MVRLSELVASVGGTCQSGADPTVRDVHIDSRRVDDGTLFAALSGGTRDGVEFVPQALERGASCVLAGRELSPCSAPLWIHPEPRVAAGRAAALVYGEPSTAQRVVGVTGTNGKSTVVSFFAHLARAAGWKPGAVGTIGVALAGGEERAATHTTPDATELQRIARANLEQGGDVLCLEASSHALEQDRLAGLLLDAAIYTNLSQDHLDYHVSMDRYAEAKARIFRCLKPGGLAVIHGDDDYAELMLRAAESAGARVITYGIGSRWDLNANELKGGPRGFHLFLEGMGIPWTGLFLPLLGRHNVQNALAALAAILGLGASSENVIPGLATISPPRGRLQEVDVGGRGFRVFVDYAHTTDALVRVLCTLQELLTSPGEEGRVLCVFGCGGGRDAGKRHPMGAAVAERADIAFITNDNPRDEDPAAIAEAILAGARTGSAEVVVELDRRAAIRAALSEAQRGDLVLIAGKGHETWQQLHAKKLPFDDAAVVREELP